MHMPSMFPILQAVSASAFSTAWSPPSQEWIEALSEAMPKARITLRYRKVGCDFAGKAVAQYGVAVDKYLDPAS
jgi:hypothetical protein